MNNNSRTLVGSWITLALFGSVLLASIELEAKAHKRKTFFKKLRDSSTDFAIRARELVQREPTVFRPWPSARPGIKAMHDSY